jgi:hypothetical protein
MKYLMPVLATAALAVAGFAVLHSGALAQSVTTSAFLGGLETGKTSVPELVVLNTTNSALSLDLKLRAADGTVLVNRAAALLVGAQATGVLNLQTELATAGVNGKPYLGTFSAQVSGESPFDQSTAIVHVTQYFGKRTKPKAAFVIRPIFGPVP